MTPELRGQIEIELAETQKDLLAFSEARAILQRRVQEVADYPVHRLMPDVTVWSGTAGVLGCLDLSVHALERTAMELKEELQKKEEEPKPSHLRLVESDE